MLFKTTQNIETFTVCFVFSSLNPYFRPANNDFIFISKIPNNTFFNQTFKNMNNKKYYSKTNVSLQFFFYVCQFVLDKRIGRCFSLYWCTACTGGCTKLSIHSDKQYNRIESTER